MQNTNTHKHTHAVALTHIWYIHMLRFTSQMHKCTCMHACMNALNQLFNKNASKHACIYVQ